MRKYTFEDSAVVSDLKYWGYWKGRQCAADGYPPESTIKELLSGRTDSSGHRILVRDMPPRAWQINAIIMRFPAELVAALIGRYCLPVKPENGQPYTPEEIARALGVSVRTYQRRLTLAKKCYKRVLFGADIVPLRPCVAT